MYSLIVVLVSFSFLYSTVYHAFDVFFKIYIIIIIIIIINKKIIIITLRTTQFTFPFS